MRLIDADEFAEFLKDAVKRQKYEDTKIDGLLTVADVIEAVISELDGTSLDGFKNAPTIEPKIVRCKDCEYCVPGYITDNDDFIPPRCGRLRQTMRISGDDYCSFGERRTDGSD